MIANDGGRFYVFDSRKRNPTLLVGDRMSEAVTDFMDHHAKVTMRVGFEGVKHFELMLPEEAVQGGETGFTLTDSEQSDQEEPDAQDGDKPKSGASKDANADKGKGKDKDKGTDNTNANDGKQTQNTTQNSATTSSTSKVLSASDLSALLSSRKTTMANLTQTTADQAKPKPKPINAALGISSALAILRKAQEKPVQGSLPTGQPPSDTALTSLHQRIMTRFLLMMNTNVGGNEDLRLAALWKACMEVVDGVTMMEAHQYEEFRWQQEIAEAATENREPEQLRFPNHQLNFLKKHGFINDKLLAQINLVLPNPDGEQ